MDKHDFILEIGSEEIPVLFQKTGVSQLKESLIKMLDRESLSYEDVEIFTTPRRMAVLITSIPEKQLDKELEIKGPPKRVAFSDIGRPTPAADGFAKNSGVKVEDLIVKNTDKGEYIFAHKKIEGKISLDIFKEKLPEIIKSISFNKSMLWENSGFRFARPVRWIMALYGKERIKIKVAGVVSSNHSLGLRVDGPANIYIDAPKNYEELLEENHIIASFEKRRKKIESQIKEISEKLDGTPVMSDSLLDEVTNLVESPMALSGSFKSEYLTLPEDVLTNVMIKHQRFFPVKNEKGIIPSFITVANGYSLNYENVINGNERVIEARLADAKFYFLEDQKKSIYKYSEKLDKLKFHEKLGSIRQKVERIKKISLFVMELGKFSRENLEKELIETCELCKADLQTLMVFEYPELQGLMGSVYAKSEGISDTISNGIYEHYLPRYRGDIVPGGDIGKIVCIADRIDTIVGGFIGGMKPTGSQDPFALRRAAFSFIENCLENNISISIKPLLKKSIELYESEIEVENSEKLIDEIFTFILSRLDTSLKDRNISYDTIDSLYSIKIDDINDILLRAMALEKIRKNSDFIKIITPAKRATNILKKEGKIVLHVSPELFIEVVESELYKIYREIDEKLDKCLEEKKYEEAFSELLRIGDVIDEYFEKVHVMDKDEKIKLNRISQLKGISTLFKRVADLSKLVIENER